MVGNDKSNILLPYGGQILYNGKKMEFFVPEEYFKRKLAEEVGTGYYLFGNFITYHYSTTEESRKDALVAHFQYPMKFFTHPDQSDFEKIDLGRGDGEQKYKVLTYYHGAVVFETMDLIKSSDNVEFFITLLMDGKLDTIDYDQIPIMLEYCKLYNGMDLKVPAMYEEVLIADYYRNRDDITRPARFTAKAKGTRVKGLTQREKASFTSTFSGLTFEDKISMLTIADNAKREGRKEIVSDVEKISLDLL